MVKFFKNLRAPGSGRFQPWSTILITVIVSLGLLMGSEALILALRYAGFHPLEVYGTGNKYLEQRLNQLDVFYKENGPARYLIIGNSKVGQGVDAELVSCAYKEVTGSPLSCVNFGFGGNTSEFLPVIFRILEEDYAPEIFVLDLIGPYQMNTFPHGKSQWLQYRSGNFSISGWMIEHFHFMRVFLRMRHWMEQPLEDYLLKAAVRDRGQLRDIGFSAERKQELLKKEIAAREDEEIFRAGRDKKLETSLAEEKSYPQVVDLVGKEKLIFFEMPLSFRVTRTLGDYGYRSERSEELSSKYGIPLIRMPDPKALPVESWMRDGMHMEREGISAFSTWLGRALAELEQPLLRRDTQE
ncbi:MAG: hypothetical protein ABIJ42_00925 [Acidobacteriota bacterium]